MLRLYFSVGDGYDSCCLYLKKLSNHCRPLRYCSRYHSTELTFVKISRIAAPNVRGFILDLHEFGLIVTAA